MGKKYKIGLVIEGDGKGGIKAISATDKALNKLSRQVKSSSKESQSFIKTIGGAAGKLGVIGAAFTSVTALAGTFAATLRTQAIHELNVLSQSFDVSVESLSSWSYAAQGLGLSSEKMGDIFKDTSDKIGDFVATGGGEAKDLFDNLNLSIDELKALKPDEQLLAIAEGLDQVGTNGEKIFYLESLADEASRLLPLLENGALGLHKMQREADLLGVTLDAVDAAKVEQASDSFRVLGGAAEGFSNQLTIQLSAAFSGLEEDVLDFLEAFGGMSGVVETVVNNTVSGLGIVINSVHAVEIILKTVENGWLQLAVVAVDALAEQAESVVWLVETPLAYLTQGISRVMDAWGQIFEAVGRYLGETGEGLADFGTSVRAASQEVAAFKLTTDDINNAQSFLRDKLSASTDQIERMKREAPGDAFVADWEAAQHAITEQAESTVALSEANDEAKLKLTETTTATKEQTEEASEYAKAWESAIERIDEAFSNGWLDLIQGNATDVFDSILGGFEQMLAEMLHLAVTKPILLNVQAGIQSFLGAGSGGFGLGSVFGSGGGSGLGGGLLGGIGSVLSAGDLLLGGGFGGAVTGIGTSLAGFGASLGLSGLGAFGSGFASTGAILGTQGVFGGLGTALGNVGSIFSGGSVLGGIGAALPVVGLIAGAASLIDGITGGKLFGSSYGYDDHGLNLRYSGGEFSGNNYTTEVKQRSLFRGRKWRTTESPLDAAIESQMNQYFDGVENLIFGAADQLGIDSVTRTESLFAGENPGDFGFVGHRWRERWQDFLNSNTVEKSQSIEDYLTGYSSSFDLSLKDLSDEEAQAAIQEWTDSVSNDLIGAIFGDVLDDMAVQGENLAQTLSRVMLQLEVVDQGFASINLSLEQLAATAGVSELAFSDDVVKEAGGTERLTTLLQGYQSAFFTEEELIGRTLEAMADQVKTALDALGLSYGDDFRANFEAASEQGLSASELVEWLEAGNLVGQFESLGARLAEVMQVDNVSGLLQGYFDDAEVVEAQSSEEQSQQQAAQIADPIVSEVASLTETVNEKIGGSNEHLVSIDNRLDQVNSAISSGLSEFTQEVKALKVETDTRFTQLTREIASVSSQTNGALQDTSNMIQDVARLLVDKYQTPPIIRQPPLL